jgi:hypothetical protein
MGLQGQFLANSLSAVNSLFCTKSQAKTLCLPSIFAFQIADALKEQKDPLNWI